MLSEQEIIRREKLNKLREYGLDPYPAALFPVTRGLGFGVYDINGEKWVGHGGSCPGYRSQLYLSWKYWCLEKAFGLMGSYPFPLEY